VPAAPYGFPGRARQPRNGTAIALSANHRVASDIPKASVATIWRRAVPPCGVHPDEMEVDCVASHLTRRPLPALIALVALLLFTGLVWWRVLHRGDGKASACAKATTSSSSGSASGPSTGPSSSGLPAPGSVTVEVLNSTNRAGIAGKARSALVAAGFTSPKAAGNEKHLVRGVAELRYAPAAANGARLLSFYLPGAKLVPSSTQKSNTVLVVLGSKYTRVASTQSVTAALSRAHLATSSPSPSPTTSASCTNSTTSAGPSTVTSAGPSAGKSTPK
jgi:LytR cell envelope-related transcriptional attenuator